MYILIIKEIFRTHSGKNEGIWKEYVKNAHESWIKGICRNQNIDFQLHDIIEYF